MYGGCCRAEGNGGGIGYNTGTGVQGFMPYSILAGCRSDMVSLERCNDDDGDMCGGRSRAGGNTQGIDMLM